MSYFLLTADTIPPGWFEPDPPPDGRPPRTIFHRRGWYYGRSYRNLVYATLPRTGHRVVLRNIGGHTTGRYQRP